MTLLTLPGLCSPEIVKARLTGLSVSNAFMTVARHLFDVVQLIQTDADGAHDQAQRKDPRFGPAILISCALTLNISDDARRRAWRQMSNLTFLLKTHGSGESAGLVAQAALKLARAVQVLDRSALAEVIDQLADAASLRAAQLQVNPGAYTAGLQLSLLRHLNA
ncbi:hypothetical protein GCM10009081_22300 [Brevundimonas nasdae]